MLQIEIDGKSVSVEQGSNIIEAAHQAGSYIPHFCYHKKLSIAANCRMCLVEVEKAPKPLPACATPVTDGMKVKTNSPLAKQAQQGVMEFLLINHPLDCPICDQGGECQLQDLAVGYGNGESRFVEAKHVAPAKDMGPLVSAAEMSRCIHCTRCVRFTEEIAGFQEIGMAHRGEHSEIMPFIGKTVTTEISGNVIDLCPVGALTSKPFRYDARSWELSRRKSISAHDALGSNLIVQTKDHRVRRVLPLENESINECWLSDRDRFAYEGLNHADRLLKPMIKQDNQWHEVDWETAFAYVAKGLNGVSKDHGKDAVGMWVNPTSTVEELFLAKKLAAGFGIHSIDSRLRQQDDRLDVNRQGALWLGQSIEELSQNQAIFVVGADLRSEQPLLTARLRRAAQNGAKISVLNARQEALHMPLHVQTAAHPQTWVKVLREMLQQSDDAASVAGSLKNAERAAVLLGAAAQQHPQYADIYAAAQALAQEFGAVIGILPTTAGSVAADLLQVRPSGQGSNLRAMLAQPKKAVVLVNVEPDADTVNGEAAMQALQAAETVIALSAYRTEALLAAADVLLPIVPFTETSGSFINMEGSLQSFYGVVQAQGEARPLWKVLRVLGNRLQLAGFDYNSSQEVLAAALPDAVCHRLSNLTAFAGDAGGDAVTLWRTGGVGIYDGDAVVRHADALQQTVQAGSPQAKIHSKTLAALGLKCGDTVSAQQAGGAALTVTVCADDSLAENVVYLPTHGDNRRLGALMNSIELKRGE
ncbi:MAG: NADH-quinone oxidoreductase subunit NuoG [Neisseria sp.]|nr:NADH-quinone oxidoreductase subunit NuoG [Neisseria sp.]